MKFIKIISAVIICVQIILSQTPAMPANTSPNWSAAGKTIRFENGQWFDGKKFRRRVLYSVGGILSDKKPDHTDETVDLENSFVIPPLADAHCHHFDSPYTAPQQIKMYLAEGVFYAKVQTNSHSGRVKAANLFNLPTSVDVKYADGALTHNYGHGIEVYEPLAAGIYAPDADTFKKIREKRRAEGDAYFVVDTADDLEKKWPKILDGKPDFIKIFLLESENFEEKKRNINTIRLGSIGLDPKLVPQIVKKAHAAGLRVSAHVDTVTDYRVALDAGVDEMAHMPGYYLEPSDKAEKYRLTDADARRSARQNLWVVVAPVAYDTFDPNSKAYDQKIVQATDPVRNANLQLLKKHHVRLAFGSDRYGHTPVDDVFYLQKHSIFSNLELLKIWTEDTPQMIFPNRRIGYLRNGYEASFLVLGSNPLTDFAALRNIKLRYKQGNKITP